MDGLTGVQMDMAISTRALELIKKLYTLRLIIYFVQIDRFERQKRQIHSKFLIVKI